MNSRDIVITLNDIISPNVSNNFILVNVLDLDFNKLQIEIKKKFHIN